ncbi:MAG: transaminase, partial [Ilumatobacteraceae bacterium]
MTGIDRSVLAGLMAQETDRFVTTHPRSGEHARAASSLVGGVPMPWMRRWPGPFPLVLEAANGARFTDIDGHEYVDLCLGDTGAMTGHAHPAVGRAIAEQLGRGATVMLPTTDASWVGDELARRFGLPKWQFALSATDANRFVLRFARGITGRPKVLVHDWCYHGTVDETLVVAMGDRTVSRPGAIGPQVNPALTTRVVQFNDLAGLEEAAAIGDVACMLIEPALTNIGMVLPDPGFHADLRRLTRETGTLLIIDETHTISTGPGGWTRSFGLEPDIFVLGKPVAGGIPCAVFGFTAEVAHRMDAARARARPAVVAVRVASAARRLAIVELADLLTRTVRVARAIGRHEAGPEVRAGGAGRALAPQRRRAEQKLRAG